MTDDEVTLGELKRNLDAFRADVDRRFMTLEQSMRSRDFVMQVQYTAEKAETNRRLDKIEEGSRWLSRTIIAAVVAVVIEGLLLVLVARGGT
jgi:hypothetical protein